jgi:glycosyltransferase involved in cell wall biosynthesis
MKVLVVCHLALPHVGGVENLVDLEVRGLADAGHDVVLVTSNGTGAGRVPQYPPNVKTVHVPAWHWLERRFGIPYPIFGPKLIAALGREIAWSDTIHAHGFIFQNSAIAVFLARILGKPCVLTDHGGIQQFGSLLAKMVARFGAETVGRLSATMAKRVVTYNSRIQKTMNRLGRRRDAEFLPNPVDGKVFYLPTATERAEARAALGWEGDRKKVLFVGRLIPAKGVPLLLNLIDPAYDLVFCGPGDPGILGDLPRTGVEYLPPRPQAELRRLYHAADALALPAEVREGFPLVVQEAIACGLPAIVGNDPGFAPYRGLSDLILCERTPESLRDAIRKAIHISRSFAMGRENGVGFFPTIEKWIEMLFPGSAKATR